MFNFSFEDHLKIDKINNLDASAAFAHDHVGQWWTRWSPAMMNSSGVSTPVSLNFDSLNIGVNISPTFNAALFIVFTNASILPSMNENFLI